MHFKSSENRVYVMARQPLPTEYRKLQQMSIIPTKRSDYFQSTLRDFFKSFRATPEKLSVLSIGCGFEPDPKLC